MNRVHRNNLRRRNGRTRDIQAGSAAVELTILVVPIMMMVLLVVLVGRLSGVRQEVVAVARDASREASLHGSEGRALASARSVVEVALGERTVSCRRFRVVPHEIDLSPGGVVTLEVECEVALADLSGLGIPGTRRVSAQATTVVDAYRGGE